MVGWLNPDLIPRRLSPHIHPYTSPISSDIPKYHPDTPKNHSRHPQTTPDTCRYQKTPLDIFKNSRQPSDNPQTLLRHPSETLKRSLVPQKLSGRSLMYVRNVVGLSRAVFRDVLRCIKVLHCAQGCNWRISPFGVEPG